MTTKWDIDNVKLSLYNADTGENLGELDGINEIQMDVNTKYETKYDKDTSRFKSIMSCSDYEMTFDCDTTNVNIEELFGFDKAAKPDSYDITYIKIVQCRKHRRKRINKKWLKRYGYKQINVESKGRQLNTYTDGTFEFKKDL